MPCVVFDVIAIGWKPTAMKARDPLCGFAAQ
jgi:hypothetical protein